MNDRPNLLVLFIGIIFWPISLIVLFIKWIIDFFPDKKDEEPKTEIKEIERPKANIEEQQSANNWNECYEPVFFMTQNEKAQFRKLITWAQKQHLYVFAKVRLADLIKPRGNNQKLFWKIQAKHVDFVVCDGNLRVKLIIELQDNSHKDPKRQERDTFMKEVLSSCGYKNIWIHNIDEAVLNKAIGIKENPTS